ncbi:MAG: response regulator, partial [Planctomycetales bacterium]|nr:response regulator [Planctomycetales bacterium]
MSSPTTLPPDSIAITPDGLDPSRVGPARSVKMRQVNAERPTGISRSHVELKASKIMIVDDEEINIRVVQRHLEQAGYRNFVTVAESKCAVDKACLERPDIVLLDVMMPEVDGLQVLHRLRALDETRHVPVVILTASADASTKLEALDIGANEFLTKPVDRVELVLRVRNALMVKVHGDQLANYSEQLEREVRLRTAELEDSRQEVIDCLARAAEYRDGDTGHHVVRVGRYVGIIAREMGFDDEYIDLLEQAAKLHDVGKIGIPDAILLKPGKLTKE